MMDNILYNNFKNISLFFFIFYCILKKEFIEFDATFINNAKTIEKS